MRASRRRPARLVAAIAAALGLGLGLPACGGQGGETAAGGHNEADGAFLHRMLHHHHHGVEMGKVAEHKGASPEVKALAHRIVSVQEHESAEMRRLLDEFRAVGQGPVVTPVKQAVDARELKALEEAPPHEFDHLFLEDMMAHHVGAADLAEYELLAGRFPKVKELAHTIKEAQVKEAQQMQRLLEGRG